MRAAGAGVVGVVDPLADEGQIEVDIGVIPLDTELNGVEGLRGSVDLVADGHVLLEPFPAPFPPDSSRSARSFMASASMNPSRSPSRTCGSLYRSIPTR